MSKEVNARVEETIRELGRQRRFDEAVSCALEHYGDELLGFLMRLSTPDVHVGEEVFQTVCIQIWMNFPKFAWKSSLRTWMYTIARNSWISACRGVKIRFADTEDIHALPAQLSRTITREWHKTEVKNELWEAISKLPEDDRTLLMLRLEREMRWSEIAQVFLEDSDVGRDQVKRKAAALRKRYERLKTALRDQLRAGS